jgi:hypothetical protein
MEAVRHCSASSGISNQIRAKEDEWNNTEVGHTEIQRDGTVARAISSFVKPVVLLGNGNALNGSDN